MLLAVALLLTGASMLVAAFFRQSIPVAVVGIAAMAIAAESLINGNKSPYHV
jgi:hypothetical protein